MQTVDTAHTVDAQIDPISERTTPGTTPAFIVPLSISLPIFLLVAALSFTVLNSVFPVFVIAPELLSQMPPEGVAKVREVAFARCRLTNTLLAVSTISLALGILLPAALVLAKRVQAHAVTYLIPIGVACSLVASVGVLLAHAAMELTSASTLGMTRTFLAHWLEFGLFGAGVGMSVGLATGNQKFTIDASQKGLVTGLIAATLFDLASIVMPQARLDTLIPGGVLWGTHESTLIVLWVAFLIVPLAIGLRSIGPKTVKQ